MRFNASAKYEAVVDQEPHCNITDVEFDKIKNVSNSSHFWMSLKTTILIVIYFFPSVSLTFYQRWLLKDFHYPIFVVLVHLIVKFGFAVIIRELLQCFKQQPRKAIGWRQLVKRVAPTGVASGLDIGLSNWGLEFVTVSLYAMTKSTTIIFILICAIIFKLEKKSWSLGLIVIMISSGLIMFTYKSTQFNAFGFCLLLLASFASGLRWTCAQLLMQKSNGIATPLDMIYYVQPWMILALIPLAIATEGQAIKENFILFQSKDVPILYITMLKIFIGAVIAFGMEFSEFLVVNHTSSLTLSIAGIFKEIVIVVLAIKWNGDILSNLNIIGLILCLCGISSHIIHKIQVQSIVNNNTGSGTALKPIDHRIDTNFIHKFGEGDIKVPLINAESQSDNSPSDNEDRDSQVLFNILNRRDSGLTINRKADDQKQGL